MWSGPGQPGPPVHRALVHLGALSQRPLAALVDIEFLLHVDCHSDQGNDVLLVEFHPGACIRYAFGLRVRLCILALPWAFGFAFSVRLWHLALLMVLHLALASHLALAFAFGFAFCR